MSLNPANIPSALITLLPAAEKWGIGDDFERANALSRATQEELEALTGSIDQINDEDLFGWLSGSESFNANPTLEYLAITNLTMAIDAAKLILKNRRI